MEKLTYTEIHDEDGNLIAVNRSDGWWIPADEANSDYQAYLASLDEQQAAIEAK